MSLRSALSGTELGYLALPSTARAWLSVVNNTDAATAQVDAAAGITFPTASLTVKNTSGNWSSITAGMLVVIGTTPGGDDIGYYRVRKAGNATTLHIGETAEGDPGLIAYAVRTQGIADNHYITVYLYRRDLWSIIPRIIASTGVIYEDYDAAVGTANSAPPPICNVTINNQYGHFATFVDDGQTYATIQFTAVGIVWPTSSSISSYAWTAPAGWGAPVAGATNSATVTYHVPRSLTNYEISVTITDNLSGATTAYRSIWVHDREGTYAPIAIDEIGRDTWDRTGARMTVTLHGQKAANIPLGAMVHVWFEFAWGGYDIPSAAKCMTGWITGINESSEPRHLSVDLEIDGPSYILQNRGSYSQWFDKKDASTNWQQLVAALSYVDFWIWWCLVHRTTITSLFNYTPLGIANTKGRMPATKVEAAGNLLAQVQGLARQYGASNFGCNPDGEMIVARHPSMVYLPDRASITIRASITNARLRKVTARRAIFNQVRKVRGEGFLWDGISVLPSSLLSDAPKEAPSQGKSDQKLDGQVVDSQDQLNQLTGDYFALLNNPRADIAFDLAHNWSVLFPAEMAFVELNMTAGVRPDNQSLVVDVILLSVSRRWTKGGAVTISATAEQQTAGTPGKTVTMTTPIINPYQPGTPITFPTTNTNKWGTPDTYVPERGLVYTYSSYAWRYSNMVSGLTVTDISPTAGQRTSLGTGYCAVVDAYRLERFIAMGSSAIGYADTAISAASVTWTLPAAAVPPSGWQWNWNIISAAARQDWFGWLASNASDDLRFYWTTDSFATINYVLVGTNLSSLTGYNACTLAQDATGTGSLWINCKGGVYHSTDWGLTWTNIFSGATRGGVNLPFSLRGGGVNNSASNLFYDKTAFNTDIEIVSGTYDKVISTTSQFVIDNGQHFNSFTLDGNYLAAVYGSNILAGGGWQKAYPYLSADGGNTWTAGAVYNAGYDTGRIGINGWPTNKDFFVIFGTQIFGYTVDRANTWTNLRAAALTAGAPDLSTVTIIPDLSLVYPIGGVR